MNAICKAQGVSQWTAFCMTGWVKTTILGMT